MIQYFYRLYSIYSYYKTMTAIPCVVLFTLCAYLFYT